MFAALLVVCCALPALTRQDPNFDNTEYCIPPTFWNSEPLSVVHRSDETTVYCPIRTFTYISIQWFVDNFTLIDPTDERYYIDGDNRMKLTMSNILTKSVNLYCQVITLCGEVISLPIKVYWVPPYMKRTVIKEIPRGGLVLRPILPYSLLPDIKWKSKVPHIYSNDNDFVGLLTKVINRDLYFAYLDLDFNERIFYYETPYGRVEYAFTRKVVFGHQNRSLRIVFPQGRQLWLLRGTSKHLIPCFFTGRYINTIFGRGDENGSEKTLYIENASDSHVGDYWCYPVEFKSFENYNRSKEYFSIHVYDPIELEDQRVGYNITVGQTAFVSCKPKVLNPEPMITWFLDEREYDPLEHLFATLDNPFVLQVRNVSLSVKCRLQLGDQDLTFSKYVKVLPSIRPKLSVPSNITLYNTTTLRINCSVNGSSVRRTMVSWNVNDTPLSTLDRDFVLESIEGVDKATILLFIDFNVSMNRLHDKIICLSDDGFRQSSESTIIYYNVEPVPKIPFLRMGVILWVPLAAVILLVIVFTGTYYYKKATYHSYETSSSGYVSYYQKCMNEFKSSLSNYPQGSGSLENLERDPKVVMDLVKDHPFTHEYIDESVKSIYVNY